MDRNETNRIMAVLNAAYPGFYRGQSVEDARAARDLWQTMLADEPYELVNIAVKVLIRNRESTFPPVIGEVTAEMYKLRHPNELTDDDAWQAVRRAIRNSTYGAREEFQNLPTPVQRAVGSPSQLRDWAMMPVDELDSVVASNFKRAFRARSESQREMDRLPADVRRELEAMAGNMFKALPEA